MPLKIFIIIATGLSIGACARSAPDYLSRPADPASKVPFAAYQNVTGETKTFRPTGPKDWGELNRRVGPQR